jgi:hypothetical protein
MPERMEQGGIAADARSSEGIAEAAESHGRRREVEKEVCLCA